MAALIIGALAAAGMVFFQGTPSGKPVTEQPGKQKQPPRVHVTTASVSVISRTLELTGSVEPYRVAGLASPAEGPVVHVRVREGDQVSAGDALLSIGRKQGLDALIDSLREELKKEEDNLRRTRRLVESEALPAEQLDEARAAYEKIRAQLIKAEETAGDYIIKAPWSGMVYRVKVKEGEFVAPRAPLMEMYDPASLVIRAAIPEKYAAEVIAGMHVDVRLDAYPDDLFQGRIERVYPYLESRLRTRTVEIAPKENVSLLPGMFARLAIRLESAEEAVVVHPEALVATPKGPVVFVVENGKAAARGVKTGIEAGNRIQIVSGIQPGDRIIVAGNEKLKDGAEVRVAEDGKPGKGSIEDASASPAGQPGTTGDGR